MITMLTGVQMQSKAYKQVFFVMRGFENGSNQ